VDKPKSPTGSLVLVLNPKDVEYLRDPVNAIKAKKQSNEPSTQAEDNS
jgi:hypothetical protein